MLKTRVEIPEISNRRLGRLVRRIKPVVSVTTLPMGRYPQDEVRVHFLELPRDLRGGNFLNRSRLGRVPFRLVEERRISTLHVPGSAGRVFSPTIAEVFSQIPDQYLFDSGQLPANHIVAFETFLEERDPKYDESGRFHVATTVLLTKASPDSGLVMRTHYT
ncbi:MAG: hypothetical protein Q7S49_00505 [bacterium]|nr:hypothetical protein [bacterium]